MSQNTMPFPILPGDQLPGSIAAMLAADPPASVVKMIGKFAEVPTLRELFVIGKHAGVYKGGMTAAVRVTFTLLSGRWERSDG